MAVLPWAQLRVQVCFGGKIFGGLITWTIMKIVAFCVGIMLTVDGDNETTLIIFCSMLALTLFGMCIFLYSRPKEKRRTFYADIGPSGRLAYYFDFDMHGQEEPVYHKT